MLFALAALMLAVTASAAPVVFTLHDHPDGALYNGTPSTAYGLRTDNNSGGVTFSVSPLLGGNRGQSVGITWDPANLAAGATIFGTAVRNDDNTLWTVNYNLSNITLLGGGGFSATAGNGTISEIGGASRSIAMTGVADSTGDVFVFAFDSHRLGGFPNHPVPNAGPNQPVGRGWIDPSKPCCDDWLVTATPGPPPGQQPIPEPGTISLMLIGIGMLVGARKMRRG